MKKKTIKNNIINFPEKLPKLVRQVEAILFAASEPLDIETIEERVQSKSGILETLKKIQSDYNNRGINLVNIRNKWSFRTAEDLAKSMALQSPPKNSQKLQ